MTRITLLAVALPIVVVASGDAQADEKILCEQVSRYNTILVTEDEQGLRTLWFETRRLRQSVAESSRSASPSFSSSDRSPLSRHPIAAPITTSHCNRKTLARIYRYSSIWDDFYS